jgi:hypothetical protein
MQMAKNAQAEMITIGLQDEGGMVDEASGNEVPNGALKEEVRDDQAAMLSPGEFVIPAYAVRYVGVERLVKLLREAKQGMEQLDDIGLTGEPNADDAGLETAMLPSDMQEGEGSAAFAVGGLQQPTGVYGANLNRPTQQQFGQQQFGQQQFAAPTQQQFAQPAAFAPSSVLASPLSAPQYKPTVPIKTDKKFTYPELQYTPGPTGPGYGVAEYVGPDGKSIFITTVGGKPLSKIPPGFKTRAVYDKDKADEKNKPIAPPTAMVRKPEDSIDPGGVGVGEGNGDGDSVTADNALPTVMTPAFAALAAWAFGDKTSLGKAGLSLATGGPMAFLAALALQAGGKAIGRGIVSNMMSKLGEKPTDGKKFTIEEVTKFTTEMGELGEQSIDSDKGGDTQITVDENTQESAVFDAREGPMNSGRTGDPQSIPIDTTGQSSRTTISPAEAAAIALTQGATGATGSRVSTSAVDTSGGYTDSSGGDVGGDSGPGGGGGAGANPDGSASDGMGGTEGGDPYGGMSGLDGGRAEGGLITVGNKTYKPEDFGFANKGAFVTKKKTRKRKTKKGKGLASSK